MGPVMLDLEGQREGAAVAALAIAALIVQAIVWVRRRWRPVRGSLLPLGRVALISWWVAIAAGALTVATGSWITASTSFGLLLVAAATTWAERRA